MGCPFLDAETTSDALDVARVTVSDPAAQKHFVERLQATAMAFGFVPQGTMRGLAEPEQRIDPNLAYQNEGLGARAEPFPESIGSEAAGASLDDRKESS